MNWEQGMELLGEIRQSVGTVVVGKEAAVDLLLAALLCGGHVLIEDVPGLGKTTLAAALARSIDCSFSRIQFTPDVTPSDITGFTMFHLQSGEKEFHQGAVMSQLVLADEINRTSPKTQSALLQAMQEGEVTVDGQTYRLPRPFLVLATQNPVELTGTYPLPEAQLDRFLLRVSLGYPSRSEEVSILAMHREKGALQPVGPVCASDDILELQELLEGVACGTAVLNYIVGISEKTRAGKEAALGVSPRGSIALMRAAMGRAMLQGRQYVLPDDVQAMAQPVLAHRLVLNPQAAMVGQTAEKLIKDILRQVPVPNM